MSSETARQLFGFSNPVGKSFQHEGETSYTVVGVLAVPDGPSHVTADVYLSATEESAAASDPDAWAQFYTQHTYVRLGDNTTPATLHTAAVTLFENRARPEATDDLRLGVQSLDNMRFRLRCCSGAKRPKQAAAPSMGFPRGSTAKNNCAPGAPLPLQHEPSRLSAFVEKSNWEKRKGSARISLTMPDGFPHVHLPTMHNVDAPDVSEKTQKSPP